MTDTKAQCAERLEERLKKAGYRAEAKDEIVSTSLGGRSVTIHPYSDRSIQIAFALQCEKTVSLEVLNDYHRHYRFGSVYAEDTLAVLHSSFLLPDEDAEDETLKDALIIFEGLISSLNSVLAPLQTEEGAEAQ